MRIPFTTPSRAARPPVPADAVPEWDPDRPDAGAVTAEYAIATIAAVGFAALLVVVLRSDAVREMLTALIRHALTAPV